VGALGRIVWFFAGAGGASGGGVGGIRDARWEGSSAGVVAAELIGAASPAHLFVHWDIASDILGCGYVSW
jgi:hypothetical protein